MLEKLWPFRLIKKTDKKESEAGGYQGEFPEVKTPVSKNIDENLRHMRTTMKNCHDFVLRPFKIGKNPEIMAFIAYFEGMVDKNLLEKSVIIPLMLESQRERINSFLKNNPYDYIENHLLASSDLKDTEQMEKAISLIHSGATALFIDGMNKALIIGTEGFKSRNIEEPVVEPVVRGPREGFTEVLRTNISMIRRKLKVPQMKVEISHMGTLTDTDVALVYIDGVANNKILEEVKRRIKRIKIDQMLDINIIDEFIRDDPFCTFPLTHHTEKPDVVAAEIISGRIAILCDGSPSAIIVPALFTEFLISNEDYYMHFSFGSFSRLIRFVAWFFSVFLPAFYVAATTFHQEMIPPSLAVSIAAAKEGTPFPTLAEVVLMGLVFEILREAGTRMPRTIGQAVTIVGTLIIGDAAVSAAIASPSTVIITALTGLSTFTMPSPELALALIPIRFFMIILGGTFGFLGIMLSFLVSVTYLASRRTFGVPYLSPLAPISRGDLKDTMIRVPWWMMIMRPRLIGWKKPQRQPYGQKPGQEKKQR